MQNLFTPNKKRLIDTFLQLVKIPSSSGNEAEIRKFLKVQIENIGFATKVDNEGNLYGLNLKDNDKLLLCAHMDTVEPAARMVPVVTSSYIKSDGTSVLGADDKACIAAILEAVTTLKDNDKSIDHIVLLFTTREETNGGVKNVRTDWLTPKIGILADNSYPLGSYIIASPFITDVEFDVIGRSAHSGSNIKEGINSLAMVVDLLRQFPPGRTNNGSFNAGILSGGTATNTIPGKMNLKGEIRSLSRNGYHLMLNKLQRSIQNVERRYGGKVNLRLKPYCEGYSYQKNDQAVKKAVIAIKQVGVKPQPIISWGASDANFLLTKGIQIVDISHGGVHPHTTYESITKHNLNKLAEIFTHYCLHD